VDRVDVVYGLLQINGEHKTEPSYWSMSGRTEQGYELRLRLDDRRRVRTFWVRGALRCSGGGTTASSWAPSKSGAPARFAARGPRFEAVEFRRYEHADRSVSTIHSRILGSVAISGARGSLLLTSTYRWPDGRHQECSSGAVRWTAD
jgi:hypothetical protein